MNSQVLSVICGDLQTRPSTSTEGGIGARHWRYSRNSTPISRDLSPRDALHRRLSQSVSSFNRNNTSSLHKSFESTVIRKAYFYHSQQMHIPLNPLGGVFFVAIKLTGTTSAGWPDAVAVKVTTALFSPSFNWFQLGTLTNTRCSGVFGDIDPRCVDTFSQVTLLNTVKVNGVGPPAPTSMYRSWIGEKLSKVIVGYGQLYPCAHWLGLSPGLFYHLNFQYPPKFRTGVTYQAPAVPSGAILITPANASFLLWTRVIIGILWMSKQSQTSATSKGTAIQTYWS